MDVGSAVGVLLRRYWVVFIGLVLTLGVTAYWYVETPPRYQATARMLLLLPADSRATEEAGSPFLYLPNGLQVLAGIIVTGPTSREFQSEMLASGLTSQYELGVEVGSPIITVSVVGGDPQNVIATRDRLIQEVEDELQTVQRDEETPPRQTAHARVYALDTTPDLVEGNRTRGTLVALGAGGLLTLLGAFAIDRGLLLLAERRRRRADAESAETSGLGWNWEREHQTAESKPAAPLAAADPVPTAAAATSAAAGLETGRSASPEAESSASGALPVAEQTSGSPADDVVDAGAERRAGEPTGDPAHGSVNGTAPRVSIDLGDGKSFEMNLDWDAPSRAGADTPGGDASDGDAPDGDAAAGEVEDKGVAEEVEAERHNLEEDANGTASSDDGSETELRLEAEQPQGGSESGDEKPSPAQESDVPSGDVTHYQRV